MFSVVVAAGHIATPDAHLRLSQARLWVETGLIELPANVGDPTHGNIAITTEGRRFSVYNPGQIIAYVPLVSLAKIIDGAVPFHHHYIAAFFASFIGPLCHFFTAWILFLTSQILRRPILHSIGIALVFAVATVFLPHSTDGYEHSQEMLGLMVAFYWGVRNYAQDYCHRRSALLAGASLGCAVLFRTSALAATPGLLTLTRRNDIPYFFLGLSPFLLIILYYNFLRFGDPFVSGYGMAWALSDSGPPLPGCFFCTPVFAGKRAAPLFASAISNSCRVVN